MLPRLPIRTLDQLHRIKGKGAARQKDAGNSRVLKGREEKEKELCSESKNSEKTRMFEM